MTATLPASAIRDAFLEACRAELAALKPGNVHIHSPGHGMEVRHFQESAAAAAPIVADAGLKVGERVRRAVEGSMAAAGCNTNLGIILLCAPLAAAAGTPLAGRTLRERLAQVLDALDAEDARCVYAAIARAKPGGLGRVEEHDVSAPPTVSLQEAMAVAAPRDRIAQAYVTDFADIFDVTLPALNAALAMAAAPSLAITTLHMMLLATLQDSHIVRKHGFEVAEQVRQKALGFRALWSPVVEPAAFGPLLEFDAWLKTRGINPGTTADFVVATLFARALAADFQSLISV